MAEYIDKPRWIPVEERVPDQNSGNLYVCLIVGGEYDQLSWYKLCYFAEGQFWIQDQLSWYELCYFAEGQFWIQYQLCESHVTHWMPLPEPPKEE